jgi:hypothetical protein
LLDGALSLTALVRVVVRVVGRRPLRRLIAVAPHLCLCVVVADAVLFIIRTGGIAVVAVVIATGSVAVIALRSMRASRPSVRPLECDAFVRGMR